MWANNKIDHFSSKKFKFRAKKRRKSGFFGVLRLYFRKTLLKFAVLLRSSSDLQGSRLLKRKRCPINKKDHFRSKKKFWAKKLRKNGFFGVFRHFFRKTSGKFAVILRLSSKLQGRRPFDCKRWPNNKKDHFGWKRSRFWAKQRLKNVFFGVFATILEENASQTCCIATIGLKFTR